MSGLIVTQLCTYPVKGCRSVPVSTAEVTPRGLASDRRWMIVDSAGNFITQRCTPLLAHIKAHDEAGSLVLENPDGQRLVVPQPLSDGERTSVQVWSSTVSALVAPTASDFVSEVVGQPARLVFQDKRAQRSINAKYGEGEVSFADGMAVLLTNEISLEELNDRIEEGQVGMERFRPNIVVSGTEPFEEDIWKTIRIGEVSFRVVKPCERCTVITVEQNDFPRSKMANGEPLKTLSRFRQVDNNIYFGQNLQPSGTGTVRVGDEVSVVDRHESPRPRIGRGASES